MKTSVVVADGTFPTNTAPILGPIREAARQAAEMGYDAISVTVNRPEETDLPAILEACREHHIAVSSLATGRIYTVDALCLGSKDEENRLAALDRMLSHAEHCVRLGGAKLIVGAVRGWTWDGGGRETYARQFRRSMEALIAKAEVLGIQVLLEAISTLDSDAFCSIAETAEYIRSFRSPALRIQLDSIHLHTNGELDFYPKILQLRDLVGQVDISDVDRMAPDGTHFDFPLFLKALKKIGYEDYLVFEFRAQPPADAARAGLQYIRALL